MAVVFLLWIWKHFSFFSEIEAAQSAKIAEITKVAETKTVRFLETFAIWVFFRRIDGRAEKGFNFIQTIWRLQYCCRMGNTVFKGV